MTRTFLPQADCIPIGGDRYRPVYRWHREDDWRVVPRSIPVAGRSAARKAAEDFLAAAMNNGRTQAEPPSTGLETALAGNVVAWRNQKLQATAERDRVFGTEMPAAIYRNGREIKIERRRRA